MTRPTAVEHRLDRERPVPACDLPAYMRADWGERTPPKKAGKATKHGAEP